MRILTATGAAAIAAALFAGPVLTASAQVGVGASVNAGAVYDQGGQVISNTNASANENANAPSGVGSSVEATTDVGIGSSTSVAPALNTTSTSSAYGTSGSTGNDAAVQTYANALMNTDADLAGVASTDSSVTVSYKVPGRFLGIFPMMIPLDATVTATGTASLSYPWYDSLSGVSASNATSELSAQVSSTESDSSYSTQGSLSDNDKVALIDTIHSFLQEWSALGNPANASAAAGATASTSVSAGY